MAKTKTTRPRLKPQPNPSKTKNTTIIRGIITEILTHKQKPQFQNETLTSRFEIGEEHLTLFLEELNPPASSLARGGSTFTAVARAARLRGRLDGARTELGSRAGAGGHASSPSVALLLSLAHSLSSSLLLSLGLSLPRALSLSLGLSLFLFSSSVLPLFFPVGLFISAGET